MGNNCRGMAPAPTKALKANFFRTGCKDNASQKALVALMKRPSTGKPRAELQSGFGDGARMAGCYSLRRAASGSVPMALRAGK